jgi:hypothetical protein
MLCNSQQTLFCQHFQSISASADDAFTFVLIQDLHDLYSALMIQMPMDTHRVLFRSYPCTFTTDEAIANLGNLKFSHSLRSPKGSKESSITTTTTTFSMTREMAKTLLSQFLEARLFMSASDPSNRTLKDRGVWQVTPKGLCMLEGFVDRSVVDGSHLNLLYAHVRPIKVIQLERAPLDDALMLTRPSLTRIIKTMMGVVPITPSSSAGSISLHSFGGNWKQTGTCHFTILVSQYGRKNRIIS